LLTGDTIYPGRLYVFDMPAFVASIERIVGFAETHPIRYLLGSHLEMSTVAGHDYPFRAKYQPNEHPLEIFPDRLPAIQSAVRSAAKGRGAHRFDDFIVYNGTPFGEVLALLARGWSWNLRYRLGRIPRKPRLSQSRVDG
jgi:hydroxyacylglutathione hydrolase